MHPWDEIYDEHGHVRPGREGLVAALAELGPDGLLARARLRDAHLSAQGITFTLSGRERPLPMDLVPRLVDPAEWQVIEAGVAQRIRAFSWWVLLPVLLAALLHNTLMGIRYHLILRDMGLRASFRSWFRIFVIGQILNTFVGQSGNIYRSVALKRSYNFEYTRTIATYAAFAWKVASA